MDDKLLAPATGALMCSVASKLTGNGVVLGDFVDQEESSISESQKKQSSEWTDEKHSLYLKSMEASFVDQLYRSLDMRGFQTQTGCSPDSSSSKRIHASTHQPSGQFKVLQHGCWSKINFRRKNSEPNESNRHLLSTGNPWIKHFRNGSRQGAVTYSSLHEKPSTPTSEQFPVSHSNTQLHYQEPGCSNTEVTDQNFVEEDAAIEKTKKPCSKKRTRSSVVARSNTCNDQVVPFHTFPVTEITGKHNSSTK